MKTVYVGTEWSKEDQNWMPEFVFTVSSDAINWMLDGVINSADEPQDGERNIVKVELVE
jgi:hypothetical protein